MKALITGGHGFAGRHLANYLVKCGDDVAVTYLTGVSDDAFATPLPAAAQSLSLDVTDPKGIEDLIGLLQPDAIYHLAGSTFVPETERDIEKAFRVNTFGTVNVLEAVRKKSPHTRVLCVSSAEVYGEPRPGSLPLVETAALRPVSNYGVSKVSADISGFKYAFRDRLHTVRVRPFNHTGPGQSDKFALSSFAKQIALVKLGKAEPVIHVGNLEAKRDYSDVSDIVRGYREALLNGIVGEAYNLCSGQAFQIGELLERLIKISQVEVEVREDPARVRAIEIPEHYGSYGKATKDFGWRPRVELDACLHSLFGYWVESLS